MVNTIMHPVVAPASMPGVVAASGAAEGNSQADAGAAFDGMMAR